VDVRTNVLSLFNVLDEISTVGFPAAIPKLTAIALLARTQDEPQEAGTKLVATMNNQNLFEFAWPLEFKGRLKSRAVADLQGVVIPGPGTLRLGLWKDDSEIAFWNIDIVQIGPPKADLFSAPEHAPPVPLGSDANKSG
jgi:hypothetical protein